MSIWEPVRKTPPMVVEIFGPEGSGKTHLACTFPDPVILDTEGRADWVVAKFGHTRLKRVHSWADLREAYDLIIRHVPPPATVVVDSASDLVDWATLEWLRQTGNQHVWPRVNWSHIYEMLNGFIDAWKRLGYTLVCCERVKPEFDSATERYTGRLVPDRYKNLPYKADFILEMLHEVQIENQTIRGPIARVHKAARLLPRHTKPYIVCPTYERIMEQLSTPWTGTDHDIIEEARAMDDQLSAAAEAERLLSMYRTEQ